MLANAILMMIKPKAKNLCFCPFKEKEEFGSVYALFGNASSSAVCACSVKARGVGIYWKILHSSRGGGITADVLWGKI